MACSPTRAGYCAYEWAIPSANRFERPGGIFNILWPASDIRNAVPGYKPYDLLSTISEIPPNELSRWEAGTTELKTFRSIYYRNEGAWKGAVVSRNTDPLGGFRITNAFNANSWVVSRVDPSANSEFPALEEWYIGICHIRRIGRNAGQPKCLFKWRARKNLAVSVSIAGINFQHLEAIKSFMNAKLRSWSTPFHQPGQCE